MPLAELTDSVRDTVARNAIGYGHYVLVTFHQSQDRPMVLATDLSVKDQEAAVREFRAAMKCRETTSRT